MSTYVVFYGKNMSPRTAKLTIFYDSENMLAC